MKGKVKMIKFEERMKQRKRIENIKDKRVDKIIKE